VSFYAVRCVPAVRRIVVLALLAGISLLGLVVVDGTARASIPPGVNGKIVFGQVFPNYGVTINPDGSDEHQIGPTGSTTCNTWSPDGSKVLCNLWGQHDVQPANANPDGSDFTLLNANLPLDLFCLSWSPDGARLLCHSEGMANPTDAGLYTVRSPDAGDLVRVTAQPPKGFDIGYGYSSDSSRVLFARHHPLFSAEPDGMGALQLTSPGLSVVDLDFFDRIGADWSPNESRVTFAGFKRTASGGFKTGLFVVNADGTGLRRITPSRLGALSAQWSPNGEWIAFTGVGRISKLWIVHPDGTGLGKIALHRLDRLDKKAFKKLKRKFLKQCKETSSDMAQCTRKAKQRAKKKAPSERLTPVWSPDSTKLLFQRFSHHGNHHRRVALWTVNADGSGLSKLTHTRRLSQYAWGTAPLGGL
jgi:dipeptidyl aminopeptidase/acylaminoacyl peptidase